MMHRNTAKALVALAHSLTAAECRLRADRRAAAAGRARAASHGATSR